MFLPVVTSPSNEQEGSLIKCLREIIGLFDFTVGNILWCQNELRTQDNSTVLLLTIGKGNDWNIIKYHGDFFENFQWWT